MPITECVYTILIKLLLSFLLEGWVAHSGSPEEMQWRTGKSGGGVGWGVENSLGTVSGGGQGRPQGRLRAPAA